MTSVARPRENFGILLDWFTVRYATVWLVLLCLVAAGAGGAGWFWHYRGRDRRNAGSQIERAEDLHRQASRFATTEKTAFMLRNAETALGEARGHFARADYPDARTSAMVSQNLSQQLIDTGRGEGTAKEEVRVARVEGDVRVKRAGEFHWESAISDMTLSLGDQIKTSATGTADLFYFDGTQTTIKPGSLLEIKELTHLSRNAQRVSEKLSFGELEASTRRQAGEGAYHEVATDTTSARSSDDAQFSVRSDQATGEAKVAVWTGQLEVEAAGQTVAMGESEQIRVTEGRVGAVEKLPPRTRLIQPLDEKVFTYPEPAQARTTIVWDRIRDAASYHLQISPKPLFADPLVDNNGVHSNSVELTGLQAGTYYWKVAVVDATGLEGPYTDVRSFRITTDRLAVKTDQVPPKLAIDDLIQNGTIVIITGATEPGATVWADNEKVLVEDSGAFKAVVRLRREGTNRVRLVAQDAEGNETARTVEAVVESY